jgi:hypothetical protein
VVTRYLISLPERLLRSTLGVGAGVAREVSEVVLPAGVRRTRLYQNLVDATLRLLIEQVAEVEGVYPGEKLPDDYLTRRTAGNAIEVLGIVAFRASPVWVLAALADLCGAGRQLIPEIAEALKAEGLLDKELQFTTVDQLLDGLERTSSQLASAINAPPLDVAALRTEWDAIRREARSLQPASLPSAEMLGAAWTQLLDASRQQERRVFETSSMMALSAIRALPESARWLSNSARVGATRTGQVMASALLDHYRSTLEQIAQTGYASYAASHLRPYFSAAVAQFSPARRTLTERLLDRIEARKDHG